MKQKIEKYLGLAALVLAVVSVMAVSSVMFAAETMGKFAPAQAGYHENMTFVGNKTAVINASAAAQMLHVGQGILDEVCVSLGADGEYAIAFDYATTDGITIASYGEAISPAVYTRNATDTGDSCYRPAGGKKFIKGLVGIRSAANGFTAFSVHSSTGSSIFIP